MTASAIPTASRRWSWWILGITALGAATASAVALIAAEASMDPSVTERNRLIALIIGVSGGAIILAALGGMAARRSLARRLAFTAMLGPLFLAAATAVGVSTLFESEHDRVLMLILVGLAATLSFILSIGPAWAVRRDIRELSAGVSALARGERNIDMSLNREDDLGQVGMEVEQLASNLAEAEAEREAAEEQRTFMLASLGHDLRTPITAIRAALESIVDGVSPDPDRYVRGSLDDLGAVESMVGDIFLLGKLEAKGFALEPEPLDVSEIVDGVSESMGPFAAQRDIRIESLAAGPEVVMGADEELHRALRNLVDNAIRHSPDGGTVAITVAGEPDGASCSVTVSDEGKGFSPEFCEEAFGSFTRAAEARDRKSGGAGLGLAIAAGITDALGGRIWAEPGPGGRVTMLLRRP